MEGRPYSRLVAEGGLSDGHWMMLGEVPDGARVLDVGCAGGYLARHLTARGCRVVGLELDAVAAATAEEHCERVLVGDFESPEDVARLPAPFDVILLGDVLEHLRDPWAALRRAHGLLGDGGRIVTSIPNIANWNARLRVLRGRFDYEDSGLFDRTHLRFFTRTTARALVRDTGFEAEREQYTQCELPGERLVGRPVLRRLRPWAARARPELFALQFVMTLHPARGRSAAPAEPAGAARPRG